MNCSGTLDASVLKLSKLDILSGEVSSGPPGREPLEALLVLSFLSAAVSMSKRISISSLVSELISSCLVSPDGVYTC